MDLVSGRNDMALLKVRGGGTVVSYKHSTPKRGAVRKKCSYGERGQGYKHRTPKGVRARRSAITSSGPTL